MFGQDTQCAQWEGKALEWFEFAYIGAPDGWGKVSSVHQEFIDFVLIVFISAYVCVCVCSATGVQDEVKYNPLLSYTIQ